MGFLDQPKLRPCVIARSLTQVPKDLLEEATFAVENPQVSSVKVEAAFARLELPGGSKAVILHRRGGCTCFRSGT